MLVEYSVVADPANDKAVPKQGSIKVVNNKDESQVICERVTQKTEANKVKIEQ